MIVTPISGAIPGCLISIFLFSQCTSTVLKHTYPARPPEPTTHKQQSSTMATSVYCHLFASPSTCGAESFLYYRSMAWIDSAKKDRVENVQRKRRFRHFQYEKPYLAAGKENCLGGIFVYRLVACSNYGVIRTFEKAVKLFSCRFFGRLKMMKID
jgi:hypothetical protein